MKHILVLFGFVFLGNIVSGHSSVPVLLWHENSYDKLPLPQSHSTLDEISTEEFKDDYIKIANKNGLPIVAVVNDELSLEQLSDSTPSDLKALNDVLETSSTIFLTNVESPVKSLKDVSSSIINLKSVDDLKEEDLLLGNLLLINVNTNIEMADAVIAKLRQKLANRDVMFVLTGERNPYAAQEENQEELSRSRRQILQANPLKEEPVPDKGTLKDIGGCLYWYTRGGKFDAVLGKTKVSMVFTSKPSNTVITNGTCFNEEKRISQGGRESFVAKITYKNMNNPQESLTFAIRFINLGQTWFAESGNLTVRQKDLPATPLRFEVGEIKAAPKFSFSCGDLKLYNYDSAQVTAQLRIFRLQLQTFKDKDVPLFAPSFDCEVWMSLSLWMGFIYMFMFVIICCVASLCLYNIKTNDRYEDPRAKPLIIQTFEE